MKNWAFCLVASAALGVTRAQSGAPDADHFDLERPELRAFIDHAVEHGGLERKRVVALLRKAVPQPKILDAMAKPAEKVTPWWQYRAHFLTEERISAGLEFWRAHREALDHIAAERGVAPEYLVAIIGVETLYGRSMGRYRVLDALATLAFSYPARADFFSGELEQFLLLTREESIDPLTAMGSYAGAMGAAQFMPSSYRRYAIDENGDGRRDLWSQWDDVLASIANFLREKGWEPGAAVLAEASVEPDANFVADPTNLELNETVDSLHTQGVDFQAPLQGSAPAILIPAEQEAGPSYRVGFRNFYVITRYNRSLRYAMAVYDLASALDARIAQAPPG
jgi:membrane-bound lytic murein transglycosylase B